MTSKKTYFTLSILFFYTDFWEYIPEKRKKKYNISLFLFWTKFFFLNGIFNFWPYSPFFFKNEKNRPLELWNCIEQKCYNFLE